MITTGTCFLTCAPYAEAPFVKAISGFDLGVAFPDMKNNYHGFFVDPFEANRVWFFTRTTVGPTVQARLRLEERNRLQKFDCSLSLLIIKDRALPDVASPLGVLAR